MNGSQTFHEHGAKEGYAALQRSRILRRTCDVEVERDGVKAASSQYLAAAYAIKPLHSLSLTASELPEKPLQAIRPIYKIEVADPYQRTLVISPLARCHAELCQYSHDLWKPQSYLTRPSLIPPSRSLMIECERANTDQADGSKLAPYE